MERCQFTEEKKKARISTPRSTYFVNTQLSFYELLPSQVTIKIVNQLDNHNQIKQSQR